jgi:hypothetical protein
MRRGTSGGSGRRLQPVAATAGSVAYAGAGTQPPNALFSVAANFGGAMQARWAPALPTPGGAERRRIQEPYRQPFGREYTRTIGRPAGWSLLASAIEKIGFPTVLLMMLIFRNWEGLVLTIGFETLITITALMVVMKGRRLEYLLKGLAVTPIRYALLVGELVTIARFASDMWLTGNRRWRK